MKITEIPENGELLLRISKDTQTFELPVEIYKVLGNGIVLKPITVNGKIINLENSGAKLQLILEREDSKPLLWGGVTYAVVRQGNYPYVALMDKRDGAEFNRRGTFRLDMDVQGKLNREEKIIVHDISGTGISFFTDKKCEKETGMPVVITFKGGYEDITVTGKIVRKQEIEERVLHGCTINSTKQVDKFLSEEQARRINRRRATK